MVMSRASLHVGSAHTNAAAQAVDYFADDVGYGGKRCMCGCAAVSA